MILGSRGRKPDRVVHWGEDRISQTVLSSRGISFFRMMVMRRVPWARALSTTLPLPSAWAAGGLHGHFQGLAEPKDAALAQIIQESVFGPADFCLQVGRLEGDRI
jgi:hypothetical protein